MRHCLPVIITLFLFSSDLTAGNDNHPVGGRSAGMAHSSVTLSDVWAGHQNQAGLIGLKSTTAGIFYENRYLIPELSLKAGIVAMPFKNGVFALSVSNFGFTLYNESKVGLAYAMKISDKVSAAVQLDYLNTQIGEGYGNKSALAGEAGIRAELTDALTIGAHIFNPTRAKLSEYNDERVPTIMRLGVDYKFSEKVFVSVETLKDMDHKAVFKAGLEYHVIEQLYLRTGISTNPALNTFGFGLELKQFKIDFATSLHSVLGYSPQLSLTYAF